MTKACPQKGSIICLIRIITVSSRIIRTSRTVRISRTIRAVRTVRISRTSSRIRTAETTAPKDKRSKDLFKSAVFHFFMGYSVFCLFFQNIRVVFLELEYYENQTNFDYKSLLFFHHQPKAAVFRAFLTNMSFYLLILLFHCYVDIGEVLLYNLQCIIRI